LDNYRNILAREAVIVIKGELRYRFFSGTKDLEVEKNEATVTQKKYIKKV
jgi:hypothetical protein